MHTKYYRIELKQVDIDRFWARLNKDGPIVSPELGQCWTWGGKLNGYGTIKIRGVHYGAHRIAFAIQNERAELTEVVCHTCDNSLCVRGDHLFAGTQLDNMRDMVRKGRRIIPKVIVSTRLTSDVVQDIRVRASLGETHGSIGMAFGISRDRVGSVVRGDTYSYVS